MFFPPSIDKVFKDGDGKEDQNHQRSSARGTERHNFFFIIFKQEEVLLMYSFMPQNIK